VIDLFLKGYYKNANSYRNLIRFNLKNTFESIILTKIQLLWRLNNYIIMDSIIVATGINKSYSSHKALENVNISIPKKSIYGLLGPNGAGKTTFIRLLTQITRPDSGTILFNDRPINVNDTLNMGYLPEERGLYKKMEVGEQAIYLAQLKGLSRPEAIKRLKYWFEKFEIASWWRKKVEELSKGMQQKIQFIVTIIHGPQLVILDEPFSGFDPINAELIKNELLRLNNSGSTIILSTHRMESVEELCTDIALINKSKVLLSGPIKEIIRTHRDNNYAFNYKGASNPSLFSKYDIISHSIGIDCNTAVIKLNDSTLNTTLLEIIPMIELVSVNEIKPTMNEIFVKTVKNDTHA